MHWMLVFWISIALQAAPAQDARPPNLERLRARLYVALAGPDLAAATVALRELRGVAPPIERPALKRLADALSSRLGERRLRRIAAARATGQLAALRKEVSDLPAGSFARLWLELELCLALDADSVSARDRREARGLVARLLDHARLLDRSLDPLLDRISRHTESTARGLGLKSPRRIADAATLRRELRRIEVDLSAGRTPHPPALVDPRSLRRKLVDITKRIESGRRRLDALDRRLERLRAQIPRMTDPQRRDARSNRGRIRYDTKLLQRARARESDRLKVLARERVRFERLKSSSRERGRDPRPR